MDPVPSDDRDVRMQEDATSSAPAQPPQKTQAEIDRLKWIEEKNK